MKTAARFETLSKASAYRIETVCQYEDADEDADVEGRAQKKKKKQTSKEERRRQTQMKTFLPGVLSASSAHAREDMAGGGSQSTRHQGQDRWAQKNARNHIDVLRRSIWLRLPGRGIAFPGSLPGGTRWAIGLRKSVRILIFAASVGIVLAGIMGLLP